MLITDASSKGKRKAAFFLPGDKARSEPGKFRGGGMPYSSAEVAAKKAGA